MTTFEKRKLCSYRIESGLLNRIDILQEKINQKRTALQGRFTKDELINDAIKLLLKQHGV